MEILKIGKQAVKVSLNEAEANKYNILNNEALNEEEIKEGFSLLLKEIKSKTDFSYNNKKLFTEIFPSKNGGCEIYISCVIAEANKTVYRIGGKFDNYSDVGSGKPKGYRYKDPARCSQGAGSR